MYSRKGVGPRMEPWGTPALPGYSCEDFLSRTTWSHLLLKKGEIRPNIWSEIPSDLGLWRGPACQTLSKAQGPNLESKIASQKNPSIARKIAFHRLKIFGVLWSILVNLWREFMKHAIVISLILHLLLLLLFFQ